MQQLSGKNIRFFKYFFCIFTVLRPQRSSLEKTRMKILDFMNKIEYTVKKTSESLL